MKFTAQQNFEKVNFTSLQGYITMEYSILEMLFRKPLEGCDKTDAEWIIEIELNKENDSEWELVSGKEQNERLGNTNTNTNTNTNATAIENNPPETKKVIATIYNYKDGKNYCGPSGSEIEDITNWHIGGHTKAIEKILTTLIEKELTKKEYEVIRPSLHRLKETNEKTTPTYSSKTKAGVEQPPLI